MFENGFQKLPVSVTPTFSSLRSVSGETIASSDWA